jgi:hypothetical protein
MKRKSLVRLISIWLLVSALTGPASVAAQDVALPAALMAAKTAAVVNAGVTQEYFERLVLELREWKRFTIVDDPSQADVTISLEGKNTIGVNPIIGTVPAVAYWLTIAHGDTTLYRDQLKGCCSFKAMTRKTLEKLDKRMREQTAQTKR